MALIPIKQNNDVNNGVVESTILEKTTCIFGNWQQWLSFYMSWTPRNKQIAVLGTYVICFRYGGILNQQLKVQIQTVSVALQAISTKKKLDGQPSL